MTGLICAAMLTTFISVNGQIMEVPVESPEAVTYTQTVDTDLGDGYTETEIDTTLSNTVSDSDAEIPQATLDNPQVVALLEESVELLSENSSSVTGTLNTSVLNLMDRMVNMYPSYYKYAGFRTSEDDAYSSILYIAKRATANGNIITFSDDCIAVKFERQTNNNYSSYIYYEVTKSPGASVDIRNRSIVYTNVLDGYPSLGTTNTQSDEWVWIIVFVIIVSVVLIRRRKHD